METNLKLSYFRLKEATNRGVPPPLPPVELNINANERRDEITINRISPTRHVFSVVAESRRGRTENKSLHKLNFLTFIPPPRPLHPLWPIIIIIIFIILGTTRLDWFWSGSAVTGTPRPLSSLRPIDGGQPRAAPPVTG